MTIILGGFLYFIMAGVVASFAIKLGYGVLHFRDERDDILGSVMIGIFWPVTFPFLIGLTISKNHKHFIELIKRYIMKLKEKE